MMTLRQSWKKLKKNFLKSILGLFLFFSPLAQAQSLKMAQGSYRDSQGLSRQRFSADAVWISKEKRGSLTEQSFELLMARENFLQEDWDSDPYTREVYGAKERVQNSANLAVRQIWNQKTETRLLGAALGDGKFATRTFSLGASHWFFHESFRMGLDLSRSFIDRPWYQTLDYDSQLVGSPPHSQLTVTTLSLRQLASPTTILDYSLSYGSSSNRPPMRSVAVQLRQFVAAVKGAMHASLVRAYNRGSIDTQTDYGQVDAWMLEGAWLQHLWLGSKARLAYRYYREDETTRAYEDHLVFGSDMLSFGIGQEIKHRYAKSPLGVYAAVSRYITNTKLSASSLEMSLTATM